MQMQKRAILLRRLVGVACVGLPLLLIWQLVFYGPVPGDMAAVFPGLAVSEAVSQTQLWLALLLGFIPFGIGLWLLVTMRALLGLYAQGQALSVDAAGDIRRIGLGLLALGVLPIVIRPVQGVLLSWNNPPGERMLSVFFGSNDIGFLLGGAVMLMIGWAMAEAAEAAAENRAFV